MAATSRDTHFMSEAHRFARKLDARPWPNPPVGAVVVQGGEIVGRGAHHGPGTPHAEVAALDRAGDRARGGTLYVTLEPCNHQGRTPPCAPRVLASGVERVVVGVRDPNPGVAGGGVELLREAGLRVDVGVLARGCLELIWPFVVTEAFARPFVLLKTAASLDGCVAPADDPHGRPFYLTCDESLAEVHRQRRWCDLVLVGAGTVRADRPRLDGRRAAGGGWSPEQDPVPGCVDARLDAAPAWRDDPFTVFTGPDADPAAAAALRDRGCTVIPCAARDGRVDPADLLARAHAAGHRAIMVEGGPRLAAAFLRAGLVDRWVRFDAPLVLGDGRRWPADFRLEEAGAFHLTRATRSDRDALTIWDRRPFLDERLRLTGVAGEDD